MTYTHQFKHFDLFCIFKVEMNIVDFQIHNHHLYIKSPHSVCCVSHSIITEYTSYLLQGFQQFKKIFSIFLVTMINRNFRLQCNERILVLNIQRTCSHSTSAVDAYRYCFNYQSEYVISQYFLCKLLSILTILFINV